MVSVMFSIAICPIQVAMASLVFEYINIDSCDSRMCQNEHAAICIALECYTLIFISHLFHIPVMSPYSVGSSRTVNLSASRLIERFMTRISNQQCVTKTLICFFSIRQMKLLERFERDLEEDQDLGIPLPPDEDVSEVNAQAALGHFASASFLKKEMLLREQEFGSF